MRYFLLPSPLTHFISKETEVQRYIIYLGMYLLSFKGNLSANCMLLATIPNYFSKTLSFLEF